MEGRSFEMDERITCQLFAKEEHWNLPLTEVKGVLLEDVLEFIPVNVRFLKTCQWQLKNPTCCQTGAARHLAKMPRGRQRRIFSSSAEL